MSNEGIFLASFSEVYVDALIVKVDRYAKKEIIHRQTETFAFTDNKFITFSKEERSLNPSLVEFNLKFFFVAVLKFLAYICEFLPRVKSCVCVCVCVTAAGGCLQQLE